MRPSSRTPSDPHIATVKLMVDGLAVVLPWIFGYIVGYVIGRRHNDGSS